MNDEDFDVELDEDVLNLCTGCGRAIQDDEDMIVVSAMRRTQGDVTQWNVFLGPRCDWRPEYSAHLKWVVEPPIRSE